MRGYGVVDPPFVLGQSGPDRRAIRIALRKPTRERRTEQRQTVLQQAESQDDPQVRRRVHEDITVHLADSRYDESTRVSFDRQLATSVDGISTCSIRASCEQRRTRQCHLGQFGFLDRYFRPRFEGRRIRKRYVERVGRIRCVWDKERIGTGYILYAYVSRDDHQHTSDRRPTSVAR